MTPTPFFESFLPGATALSIVTFAALAPILLAGSAQAAQFTINGPANSGAFGSGVTTLPNGNIVVTDPGFDAGPIADVGAVYLYRPNGTLISTLRGSSANDRIGNGDMVVLSNGNYVISSPEWDNGGIVNAGAATFGSSSRGVIGVVSAANSLVGSSTNDWVSSFGVMALNNGNYVVRSAFWDNGTSVNAGAATFGLGSSGVIGVVSPANSLVGGSREDRVGNNLVVALSNGNYVVSSTSWNNGSAREAGAATFGLGTSGISGLVSPSNSLVGSSTNDGVGNFVTALSNGNYVVGSPPWDNGATENVGAATFGSGVSGIVGVVSTANSLVGSSADDVVGGAIALSNGNYVVCSPFWDNGPTVNAGAATFSSGSSGVIGVVSPTNSLVGSSTDDFVGFNGVTALTNGNYVVLSPRWNNGPAISAGAVTFGLGSSGITGVASPANSLVGSSAGDSIGIIVTALINGNYVVSSPEWDNGAIVDVGAATFSLGSSGIIGVVSPGNSLIGSGAGSRVSRFGVTALTNGNYVVNSPQWVLGTAMGAGAATFGSGTSGVMGVVSPANSLVGSRAFDGVARAIALSNGDYVVSTPNWANGAIEKVGAVTLGSGSSGITGFISPDNSLVGSAENDLIGFSSVTAQSNGNFVVVSPFWNNGAAEFAGAITLGLSNGSVIGPLNSSHSVLGAVAKQPFPQVFGYDALRNQLAVGQPVSNSVVLQRTGFATAISIVGDTPDPSVVGQPVNFTATLSASAVPSDGQVRFIASGGESCVDTTPTMTSGTTANFSCSIVFLNSGPATVTGEYIGSIVHAYSGSGLETHTTNGEIIFANGFE